MLSGGAFSLSEGSFSLSGGAFSLSLSGSAFSLSGGSLSLSLWAGEIFTFTFQEVQERRVRLGGSLSELEDLS